MTSVLNVDTIADKAGTGPVGLTKQDPAKAWINIDMATPATNDSFNSSGITDLATGRFVNAFVTSLSNADYAVTASAADPTDASTSGNRTADGTPVNSSSLYVRASAYDNTANDVPAAAGVAHGDLA
jgi:hypothetical protein